MNQSASAPVATSAPSGYDRCGDERLRPEAVAAAAAEDTARAVRVDGDRIAIDAAGELALVPVGEASIFLGRIDGAALFAAVGAVPEGDETAWASLRDLAPRTDAARAEALFTAVALGRWIAGAPFCPACGGATDVTSAGWARRCRVCDREHFPRTDPAVIVAVTDGERLLLGSNALWENNRFSCFAGFVEAGESLESAVVREVAEESGVIVTDVRYAGSQPWPYPRSLMLGFHATVADPNAAEADGEEILEVRWFSRAEIVAALAGETDVLLPGPSSIARALIVEWAGGA